MRYLVLLATLIPSLLRAQRADFSGTWSIDVAKSTFEAVPPPTFDTLRVTRDGARYHIEATTDLGGGGTQHISYVLPVGDGDVANDLPNGARMLTTTTMQGDSLTFSSRMSMQGHTVATQSGRMYLTSDDTLVREVSIQPLVGSSLVPVRVVLVYRRR